MHVVGLELRDHPLEAPCPRTIAFRFYFRGRHDFLQVSLQARPGSMPMRPPAKWKIARSHTLAITPAECLRSAVHYSCVGRGNVSRRRYHSQTKRPKILVGCPSVGLARRVVALLGRLEHQGSLPTMIRPNTRAQTLGFHRVPLRWLLAPVEGACEAEKPDQGTNRPAGPVLLVWLCRDRYLIVCTSAGLPPEPTILPPSIFHSCFGSFTVRIRLGRLCVGSFDRQ